MNRSFSYKDAGVDIDAGDALINRIKPATASTKRQEVIGGIGGFAALCRIPEGYKKPVLVSATDGVGTKLRLALSLNQHNTIGQDLVAMCVNDLVVCGAEPLYFLDYYATGKLDIDIAQQVIESIAQGCKIAGCALVGGETAEMPGMYQFNDYDIAGFCTGVVEEDQIITGKNIIPGDALIGIASSGVHSNGFSLVRKIIDTKSINIHSTYIDNQPLSQILLEPTKIYVKSLLELIKHKYAIHGMSHITGGGLIENIPRMLPDGTAAVLNSADIELSGIFKWLQQAGNINTEEMYRVFNCGIGMVLAVAKEDQQQALKLLAETGEHARIIGYIEESNTKQVLIR